MKRMLTLTVSMLLIGSLSKADHIAPYQDVVGTSCNLNSGLSEKAAFIIHKFTLGATGSRWKFDVSLAPGSLVYGFSTLFIPIGSPAVDISLAYGECLGGTIVLGRIYAFLTPGTVSVVPAVGQSNIQFTNCSFQELSAMGGHASVDGDADGCDYDAVETSTWGKVKSLYR